MSVKHAPPGFTIAYRGAKKRWTWKQVGAPKNDDDVVEGSGFRSWQFARADLDAELSRRRERDTEAAAV